MIPFASQRGEGQDLAIHLQNEHDNEYVEVARIEGAIADDLPGAFAEWEAQASAMTKCTNYLYSLSVNPDPVQGPMSRDLYNEYIGRVAAALGLDGQPHAVVYHIKEDRSGLLREHCHVVWSRIDVQEMKAVQMSFDYDKLMTVTRQFARDHDILLAPGYYNLEDRQRQTYRQLSLYDKVQHEAVGLSRDERREIVTELWHGRDTPASFIKALEYHGYTLATGRRPFVLVDIYGHTNSLPKVIDDKAANTEAIRAFLGETFGEENLPAVEKAQEAAEEHRLSLKEFKQSERRADKIDELKAQHAERREKLEREIAALLDRQKRDRILLHDRHRAERDTQRNEYLDQTRDIKRERQEHKPRGLAGFLSKVTGVEQVQHKLHRYRDKKRYDAFVEQKHEVRDRQDEERLTYQRAQEMQALDMERKRRALDHTEKRELKSLETSFEKQQAIRYRNGHEHMPLLQLELSPPGRKAVPHKAKNRFTSEVGRELWPARKVRTRDPEVKGNTVHDQFNYAAREQVGRKNGGKVATALPLKLKPPSEKVNYHPAKLDKDPFPKPNGDRKQHHIDLTMQEFDQKQAKPDMSAQSPSQPSGTIGSEPEREDEGSLGKMAPEVPITRETLQRKFDAVASEQQSLENIAGPNSELTSLEPKQRQEPAKKFRAKLPENERDHER